MNCKAVASIIAVLLLSGISAGQSVSGVFHQEVTWSMDGTKLSYSEMTITESDGKRMMNADVYVINADGTGKMRISQERGNQYFSSWTPDGEHVVFGSADSVTKTANLFIASVDGSDRKQLTDLNGRNSQPSVSPDGRQIAFASTSESEKFQLHVMDVDGKNLKRITKDDSTAYYNPQWSPDGRRLVFYAEKGDSKDQVWTIASDGSDARLLTGGKGHNIFPSFCNDGRIIFSTNLDGEPGGVFRIAPDGSDPEQITWLRSSWARISPDGRKIAWIEGRFPSTAIFVADLDGRNRRKLAGN